LASDTLVDALLIDCSYDWGIPKDLRKLCVKARPSINLSGVDFLGANLQGANLRFANLYRADLRGADLTGADFEGADLSGANLKSADVEDVRGLNTATFSRTIVSPSIKMFLPEGLA